MKTQNGESERAALVAGLFMTAVLAVMIIASTALIVNSIAAADPGGRADVAKVNDRLKGDLDDCIDAGRENCHIEYWQDGGEVIGGEVVYKVKG